VHLSLTAATDGAALGPRTGLGAVPALALVAIAAAVGAGVALAPELMAPAVLLGVFAAAAVVAPELATLAVVALIFLNAPGVAIRSHGAPILLGAAVPLVLALPLVVALRRGERLIATQVFVALLLLLLASLLSTIESENQSVAIAKLRTFVLEGLLLYFLVSNVIRTADGLRRTLWTVLAAGTVLAAFSVMQELTFAYYDDYAGFALPDPSFVIGRSPQPRASGPLGDPNYYAQILLVAACVGLVFASRARTGLQRLLALTATGILIFAILLTYSRGTLVALALVLLTMTWLRYFKAWQMASVLVGVLLALVAVPAFTERISTLATVSSSATEATGFDPNADLSAQRRTTEVLAALSVFGDHPLVGVGPANFPLYYQEYAERIGGAVHESVPGGDEKGDEPERQAHNLLAAQLADLGVLGTLPFLAVLGLSWYGVARLRRRHLAAGRREHADLATILLLMLVAYVACGMFLTLAFERYFWLVLGLCGAATASALREPPSADATSGGAGRGAGARAARSPAGPGRAAARRAPG
jgi:putative inorganic carbon (HCO3(-)) transporter